MSLKPEEVSSRNFATSVKGYDKRQVRSFLREVAAELEKSRRGNVEAHSEVGYLKAQLAKIEEKVRSADGAYQSAQDHVSALQAERDAAVAEAGDGPAAAAADPVDHLGDQVVEVVRSAKIAARTIRSDAEAWAIESRREVEQQCSLIRQAARDYAESSRQRAELILRDAQERAADVLAEADKDAEATRARAEHYGQELRANAEMAASAVRQAADQDADLQVAVAREAAEALMASTTQKVEHLRSLEAKMRAWLESAATGILRSLDVSPDDLVGVDNGKNLSAIGEGERKAPSLGPVRAEGALGD